MLFLSEAQGRFPVGAITFVTPVRPTRTVGTANLRSSRFKNPEPAFCLREVAFTAYYPAESSSKTTNKGLHWIVRPLKESLHGIARFLSLPSWLLYPIIYLIGAFLKIPVYPNAPLLNPTTIDSSDSERISPIHQWPLVMFSHGLGGSRTAYSQLCSRLASSGKVVLSMEHRDGSGYACTPRLWGTNRKINTRPILYYSEDDIKWNNKSDDSLPTPFPLRADQLALRHQEIYLAYQAFCRFMQNDPTLELETIDEVDLDKKGWLQNSGKGSVCTENVVLVGHSFGGCTVLSILSTKPPPEYASMPVTNALVLDPWLEPLPSPGPFPVSSDSPTTESVTKSATSSLLDLDNSCILNGSDTFLPRILVLNSESFTLWTDHYQRLQDVVRCWEPRGQRIITLIGSKHMSFSDVLTLPLLSTSRARKLIDVISKLSIAFIEGNLEQVLELTPSRKMEVEIVGKNKSGWPKRKLVGSVGEIIVE